MPTVSLSSELRAASALNGTLGENAPVLDFLPEHAQVKSQPFLPRVRGASNAAQPSEPGQSQGQGAGDAAQHTEEKGIAASIGRFLHRHPNFTKEPFSHSLYQYVRASFASLPYAFGMAGVHHIYTSLDVLGKQGGYTQKGLDLLGKGKITAGILDQTSKFHNKGMKATLWRYLSRFASSPMNAVTQIALGFTMFRHVGSTFKAVRDRIMDEKNTEADTIREVKNVWPSIVEVSKRDWKAQSNSTPWAAITLGFVNAAYHPQVEGLAKRDPTKGSYWKQLKELWVNPKAKLLQNMAIFSIGYSAFFEIAERLFKDVQIREGKWPGYENSLSQKKDSISINPGVGVDAKEREKAAAEAGTQQTAVEGSGIAAGGKAEPKKPDAVPLTNPNVTQDPSTARLFWRRFIPTAVGTAAYAAMKRAGYLAAGGTMLPVNKAVLKSGFIGNIKHFLRNSKREGIATTTFAVVWMATDNITAMLDKYFNNKQEKAIADAAAKKQSAEGVFDSMLAQNDPRSSPVADVPIATNVVQMEKRIKPSEIPIARENAAQDVSVVESKTSTAPAPVIEASAAVELSSQPAPNNIVDLAAKKAQRPAKETEPPSQAVQNNIVDLSERKPQKPAQAAELHYEGALQAQAPGQLRVQNG